MSLIYYSTHYFNFRFGIPNNFVILIAEKLRQMQKRKTESPAAFALALFLKLGHKKQILTTYISNSRFINRNHPLENTLQPPLLLTGYHQSSSRESIGPLGIRIPKTLV